MAKREEIGILIRLKDAVSKGLTGIQKTAANFSNGMKTAMKTVQDSFKNSMFSAVALGTAVANFAMSAIGSIRQWVADAKKEFQEFESSLNAVYTLLDEDKFNEHAKDLESGAIKIMQDYNLSVQDVNKALFDSVSAGVDAADATKFLEAAAKLAKGGVTDLSVAVDGMTSIINAYGLEQEEATKVADAFFTAQKFGKTTVEELASSIGKVAPIARAAGMSFEETLAALSQMTLAGISTEEAVTALKGTLTAIVSPTDEAAKKFDELGIPMGGAAFEGGKFNETMQKIEQSTKGNIDEITELIPNIRGLLGVTSVATEEGLQKYDDILVAIQTDTESLTKAYEKQMNVLEEQIATEKGKLIPLKMQTGKILSIVELNFLKLGNAARETTNIFQQSFGAYGQLVTYLTKIAEKVALVTGLKKQEMSEDAKAAKEYVENLKNRNEGERAALEEKQEIKLEDKEVELENEQEFNERKAELDAVAEEARREFEEQKKEFDRMSADQKTKLIQDTLGKEKLLRTVHQADELAAKGKHEEAKAKMDLMYRDAFLKMNQDVIKQVDDSWKKHWTAMAAMAALGKDMNKKQYDALGQAWADVMTLMGEESIAAFRLMQGASIAQTIMKTYESAQGAYASLIGIPVVGPVLAATAAGIAVAAGLARVEMIRRQQPPKMEVGGRVVRGGVAELHPAEVVLNKTQAEQYANSQPQNIYLQIDGETVQKFVIASDREAEKMGRMGVR